MSSIQNMPLDARLWVYQSNRELSTEEVNSIQKSGKQFIDGWEAHGASLKASFDLLYNRFVIIAVDEKQTAASGCSVDASVRFLKQLEVDYNLNLFDRFQVAYFDEDLIKVCKLNDFRVLLKQNIVNENTLVFNNMVTNKSDFDKSWKVPVKLSWHNR